MVDEQQFAQARFRYRDAQGQDKSVPVHFNPVSLEYTITANARGEGGQATQVVGSHSAKLTLDLVFDTTDTGEDVRAKTHEVELMLKPAPGAGGRNPPPQVAPNVTFAWGTFQFEGVVDSFKATLDFFSANGVPLRAAVNLSLSNQNYRFDQQAGSRRADVSGGVVVPGGDPSSLALAGGDPLAARGIAAANGLESLRSTAAGSLALGAGGGGIGAAVAFSAGGGAGAGAGAGAAAGFSLGAGVGLSAGVGLGAQANPGDDLGAGALAGLQSRASLSVGIGGGSGEGRYFDPNRVLAAAAIPAVTAGTRFDVTGKALTQSGGSLKAAVAIRFDE
jgi:hypothetical protein